LFGMLTVFKCHGALGNAPYRKTVFFHHGCITQFLEVRLESHPPLNAVILLVRPKSHILVIHIPHFQNSKFKLLSASDTTNIIANALTVVEVGAIVEEDYPRIARTGRIGSGTPITA